ncbi:MAG TPA: hypothetical protein VII47_16510, partial [Actinomycetota bacterium]
TYLQQLKDAGLLVITRRGLGQTNLYRLPRFTSSPEGSRNSRSEKSAVQELQKTTGLEVQNLQRKEYPAKKNTQREEYPSKFEIRKDSPKGEGTTGSTPSRHVPHATPSQTSDERTNRPRVEHTAPTLPRGMTTPAAVLEARLEQLSGEGGGSQRRGRPLGSTDEREQLRAYLDDFARELHDASPLSSTITRVLALLKQADVPRERWGDLLYRSRAITQEHSAQITTLAGEGRPRGTKNKVPYFLAVLESLLGLRPLADPSPTHEAVRNGHPKDATRSRGTGQSG